MKLKPTLTGDLIAIGAAVALFTNDQALPAIALLMILQYIKTAVLE